MSGALAESSIVATGQVIRATSRALQRRVMAATTTIASARAAAIALRGSVSAAAGGATGLDHQGGGGIGCAADIAPVRQCAVKAVAAASGRPVAGPSGPYFVARAATVDSICFLPGRSSSAFVGGVRIGGSCSPGLFLVGDHGLSSLVPTRQSSSVSAMPGVRAFHPSSVNARAMATAEMVVDEEERGTSERGRGLYGLPSRQELVEDLSEVQAATGAEEKNDGLAIASLPIDREIVETLEKRGITHLFPIQKAVLQPAMEGRDLIGRAKTGTGKTLAFGIPIFESLLQESKESKRARRNGRGPRCLVLAPTRELAKQVEREFMQTVPSLATICVYGGVSIGGQERTLRKGVDMAVGTPGRVIDLIERGALDLSDVRFLVLDEADQMLAVGFEEDVEKILERVPGQRQSMLFSATMPSWVKKLSRKYLNNPLTIDLVGEDEDKLAEGIKLVAVRTTDNMKRSILADLITVYGKGAKAIVFTQTKREADDVAVSLGRTLGCQALHGDIGQHQREKTLQAFRDGRFAVLVATDVAARGLDIPNVDLVIHFELPNDAETFVHRSGRTGRAGKKGTALVMYTDSQNRTLKMIERDANCFLERVPPPHVEDVLRASSEQAKEAIERVHPDLRDVFLPAAEKLIAEKGVVALAAALAHMSGYTQPPPSRSLITLEEGCTTVRMVRTTKSRYGTLSSPRAVMGALGEYYRPAADEVGKIRMLSDRNVEGAVFDLPEKIAKELVALETDGGDVFDIPKELPRLVDEEVRGYRDNYGRFEQDPERRGSRRGGGGSFDGGRGGRGRGSRDAGRSYGGGGRGADSSRRGDRYGGERFGSTGRGAGSPSRSWDDYDRGMSSRSPPKRRMSSRSDSWDNWDLWDNAPSAPAGRR
ncbi:hypothetical protein CBR_g30167 [Chara braunii]|uniref:RNA helicase n=1 Tax=Chara braunii TaxID=69332 RepID=A0A388LCJ0_CHABU|nr:hypothetical protein CBR_g30167 [Chara braunii]|eukprot:GBG79902.1 hypothetical protein CBR_g30167 [Chara braunii]